MWWSLNWFNNKAMYSGCLFHRSLNTIECQLCTDHGYRPLDNTRTHSSYLQLAKGAQKRWRGLFLSHATRPLKSNTTAEIQATIWQYNLLWKERKSIILYIKAGFLILGNDFGLCKACSIYLLPENDPGIQTTYLICLRVLIPGSFGWHRAENSS